MKAFFKILKWVNISWGCLSILIGTAGKDPALVALGGYFILFDVLACPWMAKET